MLLFLLFPQTTFLGAKSGLTLWLFTVLPTLLPFMVVTNILVSINGDQYLSNMIAPVTKRILHISTSANYALIIGLLCGYPMGAKAITDLITNGKISKQEGQYLLCFCNNASPMFIISFICYSSLENIKYLIYIIVPIYMSSLVCCFLFKLLTKNASSITRKNEIIPNSELSFKIIDQAILGSFENLTKFGGYIIIYSIFASFVLHNIPITENLKLISLGMLEITTGISYITKSSLAINTMLPLICFFTAFGGLSITSQTASIIGKSGLSLSKYIFAKLINGILAFIISIIMLTLI